MFFFHFEDNHANYQDGASTILGANLAKTDQDQSWTIKSWHWFSVPLSIRVFDLESRLVLFTCNQLCAVAGSKCPKGGWVGVGVTVGYS